MTTIDRTFEVYAIGPVYASVCTSLPLPKATVLLNRQHPTGLDSGWAPSDDPAFRDGTPQPSACPNNPETRKHYLFNC